MNTIALIPVGLSLFLFINITLKEPVNVPPLVNNDSTFVNDNGITGQLHRDNTGKITFMGKLIPIEEYKETDFLTEIEVTDSTDFNIRVFMKTSLTNELHSLAPDKSADELVKNGNYSFSFYVDDSLTYTENLNPGAGSVESKNTMTVLRIPFISTTGEDSWGRFLWRRFMFRGGDEALEEGAHRLKIIIRPYVNFGEIMTGDIIAEGEINITILKPFVDPILTNVQQISPGSGWEISGEPYNSELIKKLNKKIAEKTFKDITSIAVIKNGKLLLEEYFNGAERNTLHDTRSVGKTFASSITGIAIKEGFIKDVNEAISKFYNLQDFSSHSQRKEKVTIKNLLTMTSGFMGNDDNEESPGYEEKMYPEANWVKFALGLPMDSTKITGTSWQYFTAGVVLLGDILDRTVPRGLEKYADKKLFNPLGIKNYQWEYTPQHVVNTAGGLRLNTLDYAKFGQLYKNGGVWNGKQVIPKTWIDESLSKQASIPGSNMFYGYLFWNTTYKVNGKSYEAFFASGNGGNKIFIFKDVPLVVVVTATAYGSPYAHPQVNKIMERYILPAVVNK